MLSKSSIQFSVDRRGCVPSLLFDLRPNYGDEDNGDLLPKVPLQALLHSVPPALLQATVNPPLYQRLWTLLGKSGSVSCGVTTPFSWVLVHKVLFVPSKSLFPQSCVSSGGSMVGLMVTSS